MLGVCEQKLPYQTVGKLLAGSPGLKITAGQRTMSGQNDDLSGQKFGSAVILTGHVHNFQINSTKNLFAVFLEILQQNHKIS